MKSTFPKGIKIEDTMGLEGALGVNGKATRWTASVEDVAEMAARAEQQLLQAYLPTTFRPGAIAEAYTNVPQVSSYNGAVRGNRITLRRFTKEWRVTEIERVELYPKDSRGGKVKLSLTRAQMDKVIAQAVAPFKLQEDAA